MLAGLDPKMLAGLDPKMLAGLDPKMFAGLDPKMFAGMDPKMLAGIDPKMLDAAAGRGGSSKSLATSIAPTTSSGLDPRLLGLDPKMLIGLDSKALQSLGLDPKIVASLLEQPSGKSGSKTPRTTSTAKISSSVTPTFSSLESR